MKKTINFIFQCLKFLWWISISTLLIIWSLSLVQVLFEESNKLLAIVLTILYTLLIIYFTILWQWIIKIARKQLKPIIKEYYLYIGFSLFFPFMIIALSALLVI